MLNKKANTSSIFCSASISRIEGAWFSSYDASVFFVEMILKFAIGVGSLDFVRNYGLDEVVLDVQERSEESTLFSLSFMADSFWLNFFSKFL